MNTVLDRSKWQYGVLKACVSHEDTQALPIQERRVHIIKQMRATAEWYRRTQQHKLLWWSIELCQIVERSTTVREALKMLTERQEQNSGQNISTPASNTGVRTPAHSILENYIGGRYE